MGNNRKSSTELLTGLTSSPPSEMKFNLDDKKQMFLLMTLVFGFIGEDPEYMDFAFKNWRCFILAVCFAVTRSAIAIVFGRCIGLLAIIFPYNILRRVLSMFGINITPNSAEFYLVAKCAVHIVVMVIDLLIPADVVYGVWLIALDVVYRYSILIAFMAIYMTLHDLADYIFLLLNPPVSRFERYSGNEQVPSTSTGSYGTTLTPNESASQGVRNFIANTTWLNDDPDFADGRKTTKSGGVFGYVQRDSPRVSPPTSHESIPVSPANRSNLMDLLQRRTRSIGETGNQVTDAGNLVRKTRGSARQDDRPDLAGDRSATRTGSILGYIWPPKNRDSPRISPAATRVKTPVRPVNESNMMELDRRARNIIENQVTESGNFVRKTRSGLTFGNYPGKFIGR